MEIGDVVVCINDKYNGYDIKIHWLTSNNHYTVLDIIKKNIEIIADDGLKVQVLRKRFKLLTDLREEKIKKILKNK